MPTVESANRCAQLVASFVPFGLGVDEGTTTAVLHSLGRTLSEGVSVAAIRKIRSLFWDFVGLALAAHFMIAWRAQRRGTSLEASPRADLPCKRRLPQSRGYREATHCKRGRLRAHRKRESGILDAHRDGIVTSTTLLANGIAFDSAAASSKRFYRLGIGVHLNLTEGMPVADASQIRTLVDREADSTWRRRACGRELPAGE